MFRLCWCVTIVVVLGQVSTAWAQSVVGSVSGLVTDQTGAALPGVTIVVRDPRGAVRAETTSGANGRFQIDAVPPGRYTAEFRLPNFAARSVDLVVPAEGASPVDVTLPLTMSADVAVTANKIKAVAELSDWLGDRLFEGR